MDREQAFNAIYLRRGRAAAARTCGYAEGTDVRFFPSSRAGFRAAAPRPRRHPARTLTKSSFDDSRYDTAAVSLLSMSIVSGRALCRLTSVCRLRHARCVLSRDTMTDRTQPGVFRTRSAHPAPSRLY